MDTERTFTLADLAAFAELSGDYNPLHTDPIAARRTQFGGCVTHGVFVLLWALDCLQDQGNSKKQWAKISAKFLRPALAGLKVSLATKAKGPNEVSITVSEASRTLLKCDVVWAELNAGAKACKVRNEIPTREIPAQTNFASAIGVVEVLELFFSVSHGMNLFPALVVAQRPDSIAMLLASTRVIGMKAPGEHSVFLELELTFAAHPEIHQPFTYCITKYRKSSQRLGVAIGGAVGYGVLWALIRPAPVAQPDMMTVRQRVSESRFVGRKILVVGGSRGLGEIAAKVLAAGGAEVMLTYRLGAADAGKIIADISGCGGKATAFQLDMSSDGWESSLTSNCPEFDHLCYFPTPPIVEGDGRTLNVPMFENFCAIYVAGFINIAQWLAKQTAGDFALFNASTVAVEKPPLRNLEYAAAKAAAGTCCRWLAGAYPKARIYTAYFPRLNTDQTTSFLSVGEHDNLETVSKELNCWLQPRTG